MLRLRRCNRKEAAITVPPPMSSCLCLPLTLSLRKLHHILNTCKHCIWHNAYRYIDMRKHTFIYNCACACVCVHLLHSLSRFSLFFMNETFVVCIIGALCLAATHRYYTYTYMHIYRHTNIYWYCLYAMTASR